MTTTDTTTTVTTTSSPDAITVPTPPGFTPISSEPGYVPKKRSSELVIRGRHVEERTNTNKPICPPVGNPGWFSQYPSAVTCGVLVVAKTTISKTYTATKTATTTLPTSTSTLTVSTLALVLLLGYPLLEQISHAAPRPPPQRP